MRGRRDRDVRFDAEVQEGDAPRLIVRGEIDIATAARFEETLQQVAAHGTPVVIDLRDTTFMDSTGLSVLVRLASSLGDPPDPAQVVLDAPQDAVRRTLTVSGIDRLVTIRD